MTLLEPTLLDLSTLRMTHDIIDYIYIYKLKYNPSFYVYYIVCEYQVSLTFLIKIAQSKARTITLITVIYLSYRAHPLPIYR